ncbi:hypothetical protein [Mycolicibacterium sarraceniae]|uniref:Uncharacterized protein n=1 Tax=Mycolicibacterium sarraceniae TaxID=1534348 RepID=A0A7I7SMP6_9MYCO|nr:hypothetical protein [Mycolicibacterium sarraceniae]BBY58222.1 hypothetical protein MSAR_13580 [Mycolicibacterium sarraceniae]
MFWERLPLIGGPLQATREEATRVGVAALTRVVELVVAQIDLTTLIREQLDIDAIVTDVDIEAIIARIDLIGLANQIIDGVDLPAIIRESTGSVTAEVMTDVRSQTARADDMISGFVDRMLGREPGIQESR